jgi:CheY-like chemotaxis protein
MPRKRILVVDDEPDVLTYLGLALKDNGYEPLVAGNASDGLSLARSERPDLVCLDVVLPGQSGISFYRALREEPELAGIPIVIVTGLTMVAHENGTLYVEGKPGIRISGPEGVIEKPVDLVQFLKTVKDLTASSGGKRHAQ